MKSDDRVRTAVVLAGGFGTRLRAAVPDLPKPLAPIAGRPFLEYLLDYWIGQGIERFVLSVGYRSDAIREHLGDAYRGAALTYVVEETPLGTGGGMLLAAAAVGDVERFLLLNGDTYFAVDLAALTAFAEAHGADWCFSVFRTTDGERYTGMAVDAAGFVAPERVAGTPGASHLANGGVTLIRTASLAIHGAPTTPRSVEADLLPAVYAAGQRVAAMESAGRFIDIGLPDDYYRAAEVIGASLPTVS